jgi:hypothetical protein
VKELLSTTAKAFTNILPALVFGACVTHVPAAWEANQPIAGSGCVNASSSEGLGTAPDHMSARKVVPIGVERSTELLELLKRERDADV